MNCQRFETLLTDYMDAALDRRVKAAVDQHVDGCESCKALLLNVVKLREELAGFPEVRVPDELVKQILEKTTGLPKKYSVWSDLVFPGIQPFLTQRYAFATLMMFVFLSFAVNVMGPGFSAFSYSQLSPSALLNQADQVAAQVYKRWHEFNDFKTQMVEEIKLFKEDLFGRLDYHLVTILFESYSESLSEETPTQEDRSSQEEENNE